jgi:sirohydrochlorin cobaltochelatase
VNPALLRGLQDAHGHGPETGGAGEAGMAAILPPRYRAPGLVVSPAPMGAAPLERDGAGRVAWDRLWQGFCELALAGGPPHRGTLLEALAPDEALADPERYAEVRAELARGLGMVTGLPVVLDGPAGWIGVACADEEMAIWLMRAIVVENVMVRREGAVLYLPAGSRFTLEGEIRNVVTVLAKTHHYWIEHQAARGAGAREGSGSAE